jgi:multidrug efflux pump subunit AcrB
MEGNSVISVEFESDADIQETLSNLKDKVDEAQTKLPADADESSVKEVSMDDSPIWTFSIS